MLKYLKTALKQPDLLITINQQQLLRLLSKNLGRIHAVLRKIHAHIFVSCSPSRSTRSSYWPKCDVNFDTMCEGPQNWSKKYFVNILMIFDGVNGVKAVQRVRRVQRVVWRVQRGVKGCEDAQSGTKNEKGCKECEGMQRCEGWCKWLEECKVWCKGTNSVDVSKGVWTEGAKVQIGVNKPLM